MATAVYTTTLVQVSYCMTRNFYFVQGYTERQKDGPIARHVDRHKYSVFAFIKPQL